MLALILGALIFGTVVAQAATLNVGPGQTYTTIQSAIDAAPASSDTIQVSLGTYNENLVWDTKNLQLLGARAGVSIVDGGGTGRCLAITNVPNAARVTGFTFTNGSPTGAVPARYGGGIFWDAAPAM